MLVGYDSEWDPVRRIMRFVYTSKGWPYQCEVSAEVMDEAFGAIADYSATFLRRWPEIRLAARDKINQRETDRHGALRISADDLLMHVNSVRSPSPACDVDSSD